MLDKDSLHIRLQNCRRLISLRAHDFWGPGKAPCILSTSPLEGREHADGGHLGYLHASASFPITEGDACLLARVWLFAATPRTVTHQASLSMGLSRQEHWSGLPFPPPGDLINAGTEPTSEPLALQAGSITIRTNYHKRRNLKRHPFIISQFCRSEVQWLSWRLGFWSHKAKVKVSTGLLSLLEALEETPFPASLPRLAEFSSYRTDVHISLPAAF